MHKITPYGGSEESKKTQVRRMFDNIAPYYDFLNHLLSLGIDRRWRKKAIRKLIPYRPQHILDIATGTGDLAFTAAKMLEPREIIGVDIADKMLDIARRKTDQYQGDTAISFISGDAEALQFDSASFDAAMVAFGVRNFGDVEKGLSEIARVLKADGRLIVLEFTRPRKFPFKQMYNIYFRHILPLIGRIMSKDPKAYKYLYESVQAFPDYENFQEVLQKTGYRTEPYQELTLGICTIYSAYKTC